MKRFSKKVLRESVTKGVVMRVFFVLFFLVCAFLSFWIGAGIHTLIEFRKHKAEWGDSRIVAVNLTSGTITVVSFDSSRGTGKGVRILPGGKVDAKFVCEADYFFIQNYTWPEKDDSEEKKETVLVSHE